MKLLAAIAMILCSSVYTVTSYTDIARASETTNIAEQGLSKITALLLAKNAPTDCRNTEGIIESIRNQYDIPAGDLAAKKNNNCTMYFYRNVSIGKTCCPPNADVVPTSGQDAVPTSSMQTISFISPSSGDIGGSHNVSIYGANFDKFSKVTFGGLPAANVTSHGDMLSVSAPAHAAGVVDVTVTNQCGVTTTLSHGYTYSAQPVISFISPTSGHIGGSKNLTLSGSNFAYAPSVPTITIGGQKAVNVTPLAGGSALSFDVPAHAAGAVNVTVTNPSAKSATLSAGYTYSAAPSITYQSDASGHIGGTENLLLMGKNFSQNSGLPTVTFGGVAGTNVSVYSGGSALFVDPPAHAAGTVSIKLINSDGQSVTLANAYTYSATPTITSLSASSGDTHGSQNLTIYGTNFAMKSGKPTVKIGGTAVSSVTSYGNALSVAPASHAAGTVSVTVTNPEGASATASNSYTYTPQPVISLLSPDTGSSSGTENIAIYGENFSYYPNVPTVTFGGEAGGNVRVYSNGQSLSVNAPAHLSGAVPVVVTNSSGNSATFRYYTYVGNICPVADLTPLFLPLLLH
jgi:hypothetical protein